MSAPFVSHIPNGTARRSAGRPVPANDSYSDQDWIGLIGISKIEGSYTNVVGLPTEMLFQKLMNYV